MEIASLPAASPVSPWRDRCARGFRGSTGVVGSESSSGLGTVFVDPIHLNVTALMFTGAIAVATASCSGSRPRPVDAARIDGNHSRPRQARPIDQVAARVDARRAHRVRDRARRRAPRRSGVLVRSLVHLTAVHPGFEPRGVLTMRVNRAPAWSRDSISRFYDVASIVSVPFPA